MTLQCLHNQQWSTVKGHCKRVHCSHPVAKGTASVVVISGEADAGSGQYHFGNRLLVTCKHGRHLKGSSTILVCQADGQWTGQPPVCESQCDTVCLNGGSCNSNNRKCTCQPGYSGDRCQHAHCILPCLHGGTCIAPYRCACRPGRTGERCQTPVCDQPCLNGGRCVSPNVCTCPHGTVGPSCRKRSDIFSSRG
ncbi:hypothetical protein DAPPUDRAFT_321251 [Daphnia pulex]|uniref:Sushi domain-containing protein n=1 Tax=Daphnia pulex TaxID=6669 RepID=E9GSD3_DAPPU|nr:hypothetical protein DAPPUDRAFT_321251 [Daphnia pulex]|eukprot:EFX77597.1 hypothetical protein DAPPUDRAFT_321251 [Daphnia pulex]